MSKVTIQTFEVIVDGLPIATEFFAEFDAARSAQWGFVNRIGAIGFRPCWTGTISCVYFNASEAMSQGWKSRGESSGKIEVTPDRRYSAGRKLAAEIESLPRTPQAQDLAYRLGYNPEHFPIDGLSIYFASHVRCLFPSERIFVRIPRTDSDGFEPDTSKLKQIEQWELEKAVAEHNAAAKRLCELEKAA